MGPGSPAHCSHLCISVLVFCAARLLVRSQATQPHSYLAAKRAWERKIGTYAVLGAHQQQSTGAKSVWSCPTLICALPTHFQSVGSWPNPCRLPAFGSLPKNFGRIAVPSVDALRPLRRPCQIGQIALPSASLVQHAAARALFVIRRVFRACFLICFAVARAWPCLARPPRRKGMGHDNKPCSTASGGFLYRPGTGNTVVHTTFCVTWPCSLPLCRLQQTDAFLVPALPNF